MASPNKEKYRRLSLFFLFLAVLSAAFIFYNALQWEEESMSRSDSWMDLIGKCIDPAGKLDPYWFSFGVRKAAHLSEYALYGFFGMLSIKCRELMGKRLYFFEAVTALLLTAIFDEFFQMFFGRTSAVYDVLIDAFGGGIGMLFAAALSAVILKRRRKNDATK